MSNEVEYKDLSFQLKKQMDDIIDVAYADEKPNLLRQFHRFTIYSSDKVLKGRLGDCRYNADGKNSSYIRILRVQNQPYKQILLTTIHEVAHHVEFSRTGASGHKEGFYAENKKLLFAAINMGILSKEDVETYKNLSQGGKKVARMTEQEYEEKPVEYKKDVVQVRVYNARYVKDILKARRFRWNSADRAWVLETKRYYLPKVLEKLNELAKFGLNPKDIKVIDSPAVISRIVRHVALEKVPFDKKDAVKALGYRWKDKRWCRDIEGDTLPPEEIRAIIEISPRIEISIE